MPWTNRGAFLDAQNFGRNTGLPTNYFVALVTGATTPSATINTLSQLTEIVAGNGYTAGGISLNRNATDFDVLTEDDTNNRALTQIKNVAWTASGGTLPASGAGARWAVLTDDNATVGNRQVLAWWDLSTDRSLNSGDTLTLADLELRWPPV